MVPLAAAGCLAAIWIASSRFAHSMMSKPPDCSLVSANGPSDTSSSPSRTRTVVASLPGRSRVPPRRIPGRPRPHPRPGSAAGRAPRRSSRSSIRHRRSSACTAWAFSGPDQRAATARTAVRRTAFASGAGRCQLTAARLAGTGHRRGPGICLMSPVSSLPVATAAHSKPASPRRGEMPLADHRQRG